MFIYLCMYVLFVYKICHRSPMKQYLIDPLIKQCNALWCTKWYRQKNKKKIREKKAVSWIQCSITYRGIAWHTHNTSQWSIRYFISLGCEIMGFCNKHWYGHQHMDGHPYVLNAKVYVLFTYQCRHNQKREKTIKHNK